jgi:hypothetical protein
VFKPTPVDVLRQPHPDQYRIDAEAARLLRITARLPAEPLRDRKGTSGRSGLPEKRGTS